MTALKGRRPAADLHAGSLQDGLAEVRRGYEDPPTLLIRHQGEPALALGVVRRHGADPVRRSRLFGQLPGRNKLKVGSRLLVSPFPEIKFIPCCCGVL